MPDPLSQDTDQRARLKKFLDKKDWPPECLDVVAAFKVKSLGQLKGVMGDPEQRKELRKKFEDSKIRGAVQLFDNLSAADIRAEIDGSCAPEAEKRKKDFAKASLSYSKALKVKQIDHQTWFALGCCLLELSQFKRAVEAFGRAVQLDDQDAEAWSNLAAALLHLDPNEATSDRPTEPITPSLSDEEEGISIEKRRDPQKNVRDALRALKQAARLKSNDYRIWSNLLIVSASLEPPSWPDILTAQSHIIDVRGNIDGESCVDVKILSALISHIVSENPQGYDPEKPGLSRILVRVLDEKIIPLITGNAELWHLMGKIYLWRSKPSKALEAEEKAWRTVTQKPGWETGTENDWNVVVQETQQLVKSYEELGQKVKTECMAAGSGEMVEKQWKFKARSAIRGVVGRGKASWEDTEGWNKLQNLLDGLRQ